jgi:hypothetical protein
MKIMAIRYWSWPLRYEGVSKSFRTGRLERELQTVQLSATRCSFIAILWVSLVGFAAITLCVAPQLVFIVVVYFVIDSVRKLLDIPSYMHMAHLIIHADVWCPKHGGSWFEAQEFWYIFTVLISPILIDEYNDKCVTRPLTSCDTLFWTKLSPVFKGGLSWSQDIYISRPAPQRPLTFQVPNFMSVLCCLGH